MAKLKAVVDKKGVVTGIEEVADLQQGDVEVKAEEGITPHDFKVANGKLEKRLFRAVLDQDMIYWGAEEVSELKESDVPIPRELDLKSGHYRWNPVATPAPRFDPLPKVMRKVQQTAPDRDRAFYELVWQMHQDKVTIPKYTLDWACWYETTLDADNGAKYGMQLNKALGKA
jgi:hypothetical protein